MKLLGNPNLKDIRSLMIKTLLLIQLCAMVTIPELLLLFYLAQQFGKFTISAVVLASSLLGLFLVTNSISALMHKIQDECTHGNPPRKELNMLLLSLIAGYLLITPGLISFVFGVLVLYTPLNIVLRKVVGKKYASLTSLLHYYVKIPSE